MADDYIDYLEVLEYGDHFANEAQKLVGVSKLVDIAELRTYVIAKRNAVASELEKQGIKQSSVRVDRKEVETNTTALRKDLEKLFHYLSSLDNEDEFDLNAFFKNGNLGSLSTLKPADLAQKAIDVLRGFAAPQNAALPDASKWKARIDSSRATLAASLDGKGSSKTESIQATASLVAAREAFLTAYNSIAKRIVSALLAEIERKDDLKLYFKDLQVNEVTPSKPAQNPEKSPSGP